MWVKVCGSRRTTEQAKRCPRPTDLRSTVINRKPVMSQKESLVLDVFLMFGRDVKVTLQDFKSKPLYCHFRNLFNFSHRRLKNFFQFKNKVFMAPKLKRGKKYFHSGSPLDVLWMFNRHLLHMFLLSGFIWVGKLLVRLQFKGTNCHVNPSNRRWDILLQIRNVNLKVGREQKSESDQSY